MPPRLGATSTMTSAGRSGRRSRVTRRGWNAAGQWVTFSGGAENLPADRFWAPANRAYAEENGGSASVFPAMTLKNAQGAIVMGWVPSTTDLLMQDWEVVP